MSRFRGRDATSSGASLHVTDDAQAKAIPTSTSRKFETGREDRRKLPERPSTSGGTKKSTGSFPKRANTVKRETRDDLFFNPLRAHGIDGPTFYNFPLPSTRPPTSPVAPQMTGKTAHHNVSEAEIGMALGSPAHPPDDWQQAQKAFEEEAVTTPRPMDDISHCDDSVVAPKQKKGRKWFGLFGKPDMKRSQTAPTTPGIQHSSQASTLTSIQAPTSTSIQASTSTSIQASTSTSIRAGTPDIRVQGPIGVEVLRSYPTVSPEGPKLDLAIPSVQMERYSVMQTLDRLKSVEEALATKEAELEARTKALTTRRANSPPPYQNSPSFSLFPATPSRQDNRESSPAREKLSLYRSNTSPAGISSARPLFAPDLNNDLHADIVFDNEIPTNRGGHEHQDSSSSTSTKKPGKHSTRSPSSSPKIKPQLQVARTWSPDKSQLLSPSSTEDSEADARSTDGQEIGNIYIASSQTSFKSRVEEKESTWQMINSKKQNPLRPIVNFWLHDKPAVRSPNAIRAIARRISRIQVNGTNPVRVLRKKVVTGDDVTARVGSPLESVSELSLRGGVLSPGKGQGGGEGRGEQALVGGKREILVKQGWKPSTPTLVVVPGLDEQWGAGSAAAGNGAGGGLNSSRERVAAMMRGDRGSPVAEQSGWEEKDGKMEMLSVSPRTEIGTGHQYRRSERVVVVDA
ncbi:hypothetical protein DID88_000083 [Monilinia fructigena]|uniref:Uncharacterized protein n=1 Tax=Monilinia fructigena TaxID=38457 RepID=A0A395IJ28_9HELO|nr:hypothetical protein DID88_000083 [Monilinia fructigena]